MQIKFGMPADGWPTADLLARLRGVSNVERKPAPSPAPAFPFGAR